MTDATRAQIRNVKAKLEHNARIQEVCWNDVMAGNEDATKLWKRCGEDNVRLLAILAELTNDASLRSQLKGITTK